MTTHTRDKLNEAAFFQQGLAAEKVDPDHYRYFMSAFISAARSITLLMQKEYAHTKGFAEWYPDRQGEMKADDEMRFFNEQRVEAIHLARLKLAEHGAIGKLRIGSEVVVVLEYPDGTTEKKVVAAKTVVSAGGFESIDWTWYFGGQLGKSSTQMATEHLAKLTAFLHA